MPIAQGGNTKIILQTESAFKVDPVVAAAQVFATISEDFKFSRNLITSQVINGQRNPSRPSAGNYEVQGSFSTELSATQATLFYHLMGDLTTAGAGPYTHTYKVGQIVNSLMIEKGFTDIGEYFKYNGCRINKASFAFKPEGFVDTSFEFLGAKETTAVASFDAAPTNYGHKPFDNFTATIAEGGVNLGYCKECTLDIENNLDGSMYVIGSQGERYDIAAGKVKVSGNMLVLLEDLTLYNKAKAGTETSIEIVLQNGIGDGSAGNEKITFTCPEVRLGTESPAVSGEAGVEYNVPFEAYYDNDANASSIVIELLNQMTNAEVLAV